MYLHCTPEACRTASSSSLSCIVFFHVCTKAVFAHWGLAYCHGSDYNMYGPAYETLKGAEAWPSQDKAAHADAFLLRLPRSPTVVQNLPHAKAPCGESLLRKEGFVRVARPKIGEQGSLLTNGHGRHVLVYRVVFSKRCRRHETFSVGRVARIRSRQVHREAEKRPMKYAHSASCPYTYL